MTLEPRFRGLVLDHQLLKEPEPKNRSKRAKFDQKQQFVGSGVTYQPPDTYGYPGGGGVVFSKDPRNLTIGSVSVNCRSVENSF